MWMDVPHVWLAGVIPAISALTIQAVLKLAGYALLLHHPESLLTLAEHVQHLHVVSFTPAHSIFLHLALSTISTIGRLSFKDTLLTCEDRTQLTLPFLHHVASRTLA